MIVADLILIAAAAGALQEAPKDPPKVTYEDSGDFRLLAMDLERRFRGRLRFAKGIPPKDVSITVKDAGYFEALDALCRAHKGVRYHDVDEIRPLLDEVAIGTGDWLEFPASYHGHLKTALVSMIRAAYRAPDGAGSMVDVNLKLFGPPWIPISDSWGVETEWKVEQALDADGKDVLTGLTERYAGDRIGVGTIGTAGENASLFRVRLRDFDPARGLRVLSGKASVRTADVTIERMTVEEGRTLEVGGAILTVDSVTVDRVQPDRNKWDIEFTFKTKAGKGPPLQRVLEGRARHDGGKGEWVRFAMRYGGQSFKVTTTAKEKPPAWIEFRVRGEERLLEVPFKINDAAFK
jgi:hypothetical protein